MTTHYILYDRWKLFVRKLWTCKKWIFISSQKNCNKNIYLCINVATRKRQRVEQAYCDHSGDLYNSPMPINRRSSNLTFFAAASAAWRRGIAAGAVEKGKKRKTKYALCWSRSDRKFDINDSQLAVAVTTKAHLESRCCCLRSNQLTNQKWSVDQCSRQHIQTYVYSVSLASAVTVVFVAVVVDIIAWCLHH